VAPDAELAAPVNIQSAWILGVIEREAMAVFAHDSSVRRIFNVIVLFFMAWNAVCRSSVLNLNAFPVRLIPLTVPAVHIAALMRSEIRWYQENPEQQNQEHNSESNKQWPPDMTHLRYLSDRLSQQWQL
jgi:hypothetical protein